MSAIPGRQLTRKGEKRECSVLITDLDNTLWDWVELWHASFGALLSEVVRISGLPQDVLEPEIREVHQRHRTSEYALLLQELPSLQRLHPGEDIQRVYAEAIDAHRLARRTFAKLYPGVRETLQHAHDAGTLLLGYTESMAFYTADRLRRTGLDDLLDFLYSAPDHDLPAGLSPEQLRTYPEEHYKLRRTVHRHTPHGALKPDPSLLMKIVSDVGADPSDVIYVGDSLMKDIVMARDAGIVDVWAKYGEAQQRDEYKLLRRVSHWTQADIEREKTLRQEHVNPSYVIDGFADLLSLFSFVSRSTPMPPDLGE